MIKTNKKYKEWQQSGETKNYITFFTPTYNRAKFIHRTYNCLLEQTNKRFVWIVVNDGSTDNTDEVVTEMLNENKLPMVFISKPNGGKHSAFECAFEETKTEYFQCMDDDDIYYPHSVETFLREWENIKKEGKVGIVGAIRCLAQETDGRIVSKKPFDRALLGKSVDQTTLESNYIKHEYFENWTCYRTEALRNIDLFPKDYWLREQHKFFLEGIWQGRFARKYQCRYLFVVLRDYCHDAETSLTRAHKTRQHYMNMFINTKMIVDEQLDYKIKYPMDLLKSVVVISVLRHKLRIPFVELTRHTQSSLLKVLYVLLYPVAYFFRKPIIRD